MTDKISSEAFIKAFGNGVKDNREITYISDEVSSETDILIPLSEVENDLNMREAYEAGYEKAKTSLWDMAYKNVDNNEFLRQGLDMMRNAGYTIEYDKVTKRFTCIPPKNTK